MSRQLALRELAYRNLQRQKPAPSLLDIRFPKQCDFVRDPARLKAAFCTRRGAKSYSGGIDLVQNLLNFSSTNCLYLAPTQKMARAIMWKDVLKDIDEKHSLKSEFNASRLEMTTRNGSVLYLGGADCDEREMDKLLGRKYKKIVIDEAQSWKIDLRRLIYGVLMPATADFKGSVDILGTAGNVTSGLFYDITRPPTEDVPREAGWSVHEWSAYDNPYVAKRWAEDIEEIRRTRPLFMATPLFRQWYLNEWVIDDDALVYKFNPAVNLCAHLPVELSGWRYLLGVDLGHSPDSTGFVIGAYHDLDPNLYLVHAEKHLKMDFTSVARRIKALEKDYSFEVKVADGANKQGLAELNNRHHCGLIAAEKHGKVEYINLFNGELQEGLIKLLPGAKPLAEEWKALVWVTEAGKIVEPREEHPAIHNDLADPALYLWRHAYTYLWKAPEKKPEPGTLESWEPDHIKKLEDEVKRDQNPNALDQAWDEAWNPDGDDGPPGDFS